MVLATLTFFAWIFIAGGSNGAGYLAVRTGNTILDLIHDYTGHVFAMLATVLFVQVVSLPRITVHLATGTGEPARRLRVWYIPGSLRLMGDSWTWREPGGCTGQVNRRWFTKGGLVGGWWISTEVERNKVGREIYYETARIEVTRSAAKDAQLRLLLERNAAAEKLAGGPK